MKLSEAIRLGALLKPQGFDDGPFGASDQHTCAFHAACEAIGHPRYGGESYDSWGRLGVWEAPCPVANCDRNRYPWNTVAHLNDDHRWTREQIADWVQAIEDAQAGAVESTQLVGVDVQP